MQRQDLTFCVCVELCIVLGSYEVRHNAADICNRKSPCQICSTRAILEVSYIPRRGRDLESPDVAVLRSALDVQVI